MKILFILTATLLTTVFTHPNPFKNPPILPREINANKPANMHLISYTLPDCSPIGYSYDHPNVLYSVNNPVEIRSYWTSRDLDPSEQLDFSTYPLGTVERDLDPHCGLFVEKAPPAIKQGCHTLGRGAMCFRLWHH